MAASKKTAVDNVAGLEQQLAALKTQLTKARADQAADAQEGVAGAVRRVVSTSERDFDGSLQKTGRHHRGSKALHRRVAGQGRRWR